MTQRIEVGQRWQSKDPRDGGLIVTVLEADRGIDHGFVTVQRFRRSRMRTETLRRRYRLIENGAA